MEEKEDWASGKGWEARAEPGPEFGCWRLVVWGQSPLGFLIMTESEKEKQLGVNLAL